MTAMRAARAAAWALAASWLGSGTWAFVAPRSFYDRAAPWPPYNGAVVALAPLGGGALRVVPATPRGTRGL